MFSHFAKKYTYLCKISVFSMQSYVKKKKNVKKKH